VLTVTPDQNLASPHLWLRRLGVTLWLVSSIIATPAALADTFQGWVVGVYDGDTITVLDAAKKQHKVRLAGIDAPEKGQQFGKAAKEYLSGLVFQRTVDLDCFKRDRYGREICRVYRGGTDIPLEQIRAGLAWHYVAYAKDQTPAEQVAYQKAEADARGVRRSLWQDKNPEPPWEWRAQRRQKKANLKPPRTSVQ
jgi:endonuclease YncB( thermonuclease family)